MQRPDGSWGWQGGKDLAKTAEYTWQFCRGLLKCWVERKAGLKAAKPFKTSRTLKKKPVGKFGKPCIRSQKAGSSAKQKQQKQVRPPVRISLRRSPRLAERAATGR